MHLKTVLSLLPSQSPPQGQSVDIHFIKAIRRVLAQRHLVVHHGVLVRQDLLAHEDEKDFFINDDPMIVLMEFTRLKNLRLVDVFTSMDTDKSWSLSRDEFREGLLVSMTGSKLIFFFNLFLQTVFSWILPTATGQCLGIKVCVILEGFQGFSR